VGSKQKIVIVGGGFGGAYCARALERIPRADRLDVTLIDRNNYFLFYPLLVEAGVGSLEPRHVVAPIRSFLRATQFRMAEVGDIDLDRRRVHCRHPVTGRAESLPYDQLVLAPGSVTRLPDVAGLREHGHEMKGLGDAVALRDRAVASLEAAAAEPDRQRRRQLLHFVVVGANFTGVEVAGEYDHFLSDAVRRYPGLSKGDQRVTLVEMADRILPALDEGLAAYARRHLERRGVDVRLNTTVERIGRERVTLSDGEQLAAETVIWCAGIAPNPLLARLDLPRDEHGYLECEADLRVAGREDVWALGDAAVNRDRHGETRPATAQQAVQQARCLARNLGRAASGQPTRALSGRSLGSVAALGCRTGVAKVLGVKLSGFPAWWLYRTIYLLKMPGLARKLRIALDWTIGLLFSPDVVQLGVRAPTPDKGGSTRWNPAQPAETATTRASR
jgi:NADH dehydrogenase